MSYKSYLENSDSDERAFSQQMAAMLSKASNTPVTQRDFVAWAGDDNGATLDGCGKVDKLVREFLGETLYDDAAASARMLTVLEAELKKRTG